MLPRLPFEPRCPRPRSSTWNRISTGHPALSDELLAEQRAHVVPDGPAHQARGRNHVETVQQADAAQKPFGKNGIRLGGAEELVEQVADGLVPPARVPGGVVQG